jgi:hypothetical protein
VALVWPINYDTCVALVGSCNNNIFCSVLLFIYYIPTITINTISKMKRKTTLSYYICKHVLLNVITHHFYIIFSSKLLRVMKNANTDISLCTYTSTYYIQEYLDFPFGIFYNVYFIQWIWKCKYKFKLKSKADQQ